MIKTQQFLISKSRGSVLLSLILDFLDLLLDSLQAKVNEDIDRTDSNRPYINICIVDRNVKPNTLWTFYSCLFPALPFRHLCTSRSMAGSSSSSSWTKVTMRQRARGSHMKAMLASPESLPKHQQTLELFWRSRFWTNPVISRFLVRWPAHGSRNLMNW